MGRARRALLTALAAAAGSPAAAQLSHDVIVHAVLDDHAAYNDVWGYVAPNGGEYALLGTYGGTAVVNVSTPWAPYETGYVPGPGSTWRDIKTYRHWAYVTNESSGGLEIIDLADPESPVDLPNYTGFSTAHNLYVDTTTARCYIAGSDLAAGGVRILSLADPAAPVEIGSWEDVYFHDVTVQDDVLYGSAIYDATLRVLNAASPGALAPIATIGGYPQAFTHAAWPTADGTHVMTTDEVSGAACRMWNLATLMQTDLYLPSPGTIPHNVVIDGDLAFISHYTLGVRVVDVSDPAAMQEVAWHDTWPTDDNGSTNGCWGVFPLFASRPGLFVASDRATGLYVLEYKGPLGVLAGSVTETGTGTPIAGAQVKLLESGILSVADSAGAFVLQDAAGAVTLEAAAFGYAAAQAPATIVAGDTAAAAVQLVPLPSAAMSGTVIRAAGGAPLSGATVELIGTPIALTTDSSGAFVHPSVPEGHYSVRVGAFGWGRLTLPLTVVAGVPAQLDAEMQAAFVAQDFETLVSGWSIGGNAAGGRWELGDPEGTLGGTVQPEDDRTPSPGTIAWVTDAVAGPAVNSGDVDGGTTVLTSPIFSLGALQDPHLSYWLWYQTGAAGNATTDFFVAEVSSNGGGTWTVLEAVDEGRAEWVERDFRLADFVVPGNLMRFRFTAQDTGAVSVNEAALDDLQIYVPATSVPTAAPAPEADGAVLSASLGPGFPNPARAGASVSLQLRLSRRGEVRADVYDVGGRRVASLARGILDPGTHPVIWDGRERGGAPAAAGAYLVRVSAAGEILARKILVLR
jgi:choice-of-anchor B domain-containing protein